MNSPGINLTRNLILQPNVIEGQFNRRQVKALVPMRPDGRITLVSNDKLSRKALFLVMVVHVFVFATLINAATTQPKVNNPVKPMLVSLVAAPAPEPEVVPLLPTPEIVQQKPEPVVKKQKPKPVVKEVTPEPQPIAAEQPVVTEPAPAAITPEPPVVVAKAPEPAPPEELPLAEPKVEPPRFGAAYLENPSPAYPAQSRRLGEEGRVMLRVLVSESGDAEAVEIDTGSGSGRLDKAALEAVRKWRFIPAKRNNQPVSAYVIVPIKFSLES